MMDKELPFLDPDPIPEKYLRNPTWREEAARIVRIFAWLSSLWLLVFLMGMQVLE